METIQQESLTSKKYFYQQLEKFTILGTNNFKIKSIDFYIGNVDNCICFQHIKLKFINI